MLNIRQRAQIVTPYSFSLAQGVGSLDFEELMTSENTDETIEMSNLGMTVFNKEPILLEHTITHIPPIGQGGGTRPGIAIDLYRMDDPDGAPVAVLKRVKTHIGAWQ